MDPLTAVTEAVEALKEALPALLEACTDPQALDMAELLYVIREARTTLYGCEQDAEHTLGRALIADQVIEGEWWVERRRSPDRKSWDHEAWQRDVRKNALRATGLLGAHVYSADGEELPAGVLQELLAKVQSVHGAQAPKVSQSAGLRAFGLDPMDYCETSPGSVKVSVRRMAADAEPAEEGATDAA